MKDMDLQKQLNEQSEFSEKVINKLELSPCITKFLVSDTIFIAFQTMTNRGASIVELAEELSLTVRESMESTLPNNLKSSKHIEKASKQMSLFAIGFVMGYQEGLSEE